MKAPSATGQDFDSWRASCRALSPRPILAALALLFFALAPAAHAATKYVPDAEFPPPFPDNSTWIPSEFFSVRAQGIAVSNTNGHIYVADSGRGEVFDYESTADKIAAGWNGGNTPAGSFGGGRVSVAVDNTSGDVYVADSTHAVIDKFDQDGNLIESFGDTEPALDGQLAGIDTPAGSFVPPTGFYSIFAIAIDQASHQLYVLDGGHQAIDVFDQSGAYLRQITAAPAGLYTEGGANATAIAVSAATGNVFVADAGSHRVFAFDSSGALLSTWDGGELPNGPDSATPEGEFGNSTMAVVVRDATQEVLVANGSYLWSVNSFTESGDFIPPQRTRENVELFNLGGIAVDQASGRLYASSQYSGRIQIFKPQIVPDVEINPASGVTTSSATLTGHVDTGGGGNVTACRFEYIEEGDYLRAVSSPDRWQGAGQVPCQTNPPSNLPYTGPADVSATITGLKPGHQYRLRLVAASAEGSNADLTANIVTEGEYHFASTIGAPGSGDGQLTEPQDVAVDAATGDVYVADTGNDRIVKFNASGDFVSAWGWGVDDGGNSSQVCTTGCQAGISGSAPGQFQEPRYVEVDNTTGPSAHSVYVAEAADGTVQKFTPSGQLISGWGEGGSLDFSHDGAIRGMTVSTLGDLWVVAYLPVFPTPVYGWTQVGQDGNARARLDGTSLEIGTPGNGGIEIGSTGGFYMAREAGSGGGIIYKHPNGRQGSVVYVYPLVYDSSNSDSGLVLDRTSNDLYVSQRTHIDQLRPHVGCVEAPTPVNPPQNACDPDDTFGQGHLKGASGLAFAPTTRAVYAADSIEDRVAVFLPVPMPAVRTGEAEPAGAAAASLSGHVDPATAGTVTACRFEWGTDLAYGQVMPCQPGGSLSQGTDVSASLTGLAPVGTYHYRLVAEGSNGWPSYGEDRSFTMPPGPPSVEGADATEVTSTGATLNARVNPLGSQAVFRFQLGTTTEYGKSTAVSPPVGEDEASHLVSRSIGNLEPGTTYHFRVIAFNFSGQTVGPDRTFNTPATPLVANSSVSDVTTTTATFHATVRPGFSPTALRLGYGQTAPLGAEVTATLGADGDSHPVRLQLSGLAPDATYHARLVATNEAGSDTGTEVVFTTASLPTEAPKPTCRRGLVRRGGKCRKPRKNRAHRHPQGHGHGKKGGRRHD